MEQKVMTRTHMGDFLRGYETGLGLHTHETGMKLGMKLASKTVAMKPLLNRKFVPSRSETKYETAMKPSLKSRVCN